MSSGSRPSTGSQLRPLIAVLMTCHDRREATVRCLQSLAAAAARAGLDDRIRLFATDDGSSDGTGEAIAATWPGATVIDGDGDLFWAGGMALAERTALATEPGLTHLLWLNDDVVLSTDALEVMLRVAADAPGDLVVGALDDGGSGTITYSGVWLTSGWHPLRFELAQPIDRPIAVDAMNGNLVLVPIDPARRLGGIDGGFQHAFADFDYALRVRQSGSRILLAPGALGHCTRPEATPLTVAAPAAADRWRRISDRKGRAAGDQRRYLARHGSQAARLLAAVPYLQFAASELRRLPVIGRLVPRRALERSLR